MVIGKIKYFAIILFSIFGINCNLNHEENQNENITLKINENTLIIQLCTSNIIRISHTLKNRNIQPESLIVNAQWKPVPYKKNETDSKLIKMNYLQYPLNFRVSKPV